MLKGDIWRPRLRTAAAMALLCRSQLLVRWAPFHQWRDGLGFDAGPSDRGSLARARQLAADIEWAAKRLPFDVKCLPRAMALSWKLQRLHISHAVVIAVRPGQHRQSPDALHAWVEVNGEKILGDLPGPWIETFRNGT